MRTSEHPAVSHKFILKKLEPFQNPVPKRGWFCNGFDVAKANRQMVFRLGFQKAKTMQTTKKNTNKSQNTKQILTKRQNGTKAAAVGICLFCHASIATRMAQAVKTLRSHSSIYQEGSKKSSLQFWNWSYHFFNHRSKEWQKTSQKPVRESRNIYTRDTRVDASSFPKQDVDSRRAKAKTRDFFLLAGAELARSVMGQSDSSRIDRRKNLYNSAQTFQHGGTKGETRTNPQQQKQESTKSPKK